MALKSTPVELSPGLPLRTLKVTVIQGPDAGRSLVAREDSMTIGTAAGNDLVLTDETVSRYHLELVVKADRIQVIDHGSTNGTACGGALIERGTVGPGAVLSLGRTQITVAPGAKKNVAAYARERMGRVLGRSPSMQRLMERAERAAATDVSILIHGETGTGKEVLAQQIHGTSARRDKAFETVDCASLLPTLIASELFGHEKGAFTGAEREHVGAFERAHGGTLFLDEIGELPAALQPTLLGALERRSFRRIGGQKPITVDVRVVCATHRDLRAEVNAGRFREDLLYRLGVVVLQIPPLRERPEDLPLLIEHFLRGSGYSGPVSAVVPAEAMEALAQHQWPGNVRELRNFVEATLALGETPRLHGGPAASLSFGPLLELAYNEAKERLVSGFERAYLERAMERADGHVTSAAGSAKMNRSHFLELLKRHGLKDPRGARGEG